MKSNQIEILIDDLHMYQIHGCKSMIEKDIHMDVKDMDLKDMHMEVKDMDIVEKGHVQKAYELIGIVKCKDAKDIAHAHGCIVKKQDISSTISS